MIVKEEKNRLTIEYSSYIKEKWFGFVFLTFSLFLNIGLWRSIISEPSTTNIAEIAFITILGLFFLLFGIALVWGRPDLFTFDRTSGEFVISHRTLITHRMEKFPLSDIEAVRLVKETTDKRSDDYYVSLIMKVRDVNSSPYGKALRITAGGSRNDGQTITFYKTSFWWKK